MMQYDDDEEILEARQNNFCTNDEESTFVGCDDLLIDEPLEDWMDDGGDVGVCSRMNQICWLRSEHNAITY